LGKDLHHGFLILIGTTIYTHMVFKMFVKLFYFKNVYKNTKFNFGGKGFEGKGPSVGRFLQFFSKNNAFLCIIWPK